MKIDKFIKGHDKRMRRESKWVGITLHHTGIGGRKEVSEKLWAKLYKNLTAYLGRKDGSYVSCHYTVGRNGEITQVVDPDNFEAWHAGKSEYFHPLKKRIVQNWNRYSIGIEIIGDGALIPYSDEQYERVAELCAHLMRRFPSIHPINIVGHLHIAPKRKSDPAKFDWYRFFKLLYAKL